MNSLTSIIIAVLLAFSYKIIDVTIRLIIGKTIYQKIENEVIYIWGILLTGCIYFYEDNYVFHLPDLYGSVSLLIFSTVIVNLFISRYSGYQPIGKKRILNFVIFYPIIEEIIFRGMIIPILNKSLPLNSYFEIFHLPITIPILISAFLFAVSHLQYYRLNRTSINFMIFAFFGGIIFGMISHYTSSIIFSILLHIEFNLLSVYYSKRRS